jgi:UDP-2,3-diacylglucosamine pyrophosphatase LpxH
VSTGYFISDLHLFSRRSHAERHVEDIYAAAAGAEMFVLGGDIFDFRWTTLASVDETVEAAIRWLEQLVAPHPECEFHFVLGNHDSHVPFVDRLQALADDTPNLQWHRYYLRTGSSLFLHGDVADRKMSQQSLSQKRARCEQDEKRGQAANLLYELAMQSQLHKLAAKVAHPKRRVAKRILAYLQDIGHGPQNGLKDVYFGHTHAAMSNYQYGGLTFHNGGAPIRGLEFRIVETARSQ